MRANSSAEGYIEQRYRFICKAAVAAPSMLRVSHMKPDARFCSKSGADCTDTGENGTADEPPFPIALKLQGKRHDNVKVSDVNSSSMGDSVVPFKGNRRKNRKKSNVITDLVDGVKFVGRRNKRPKSHRRVFKGFCGCRDLGMFRICHKCKGRHWL